MQDAAALMALRLAQVADFAVRFVHQNQRFRIRCQIGEAVTGIPLLIRHRPLQTVAPLHRGGRFRQHFATHHTASPNPDAALTFLGVGFCYARMVKSRRLSNPKSGYQCG